MDLKDLGLKLVSLSRRLVPVPTMLNTYRFLRYAPLDVLDLARANRDPLIPPRRKVFTGGGAFRQIGDEFFGYFVRYGEIRPQHRILDIGSGIGRMARPFVSFLDSARGRYDGFDIDRGGVAWCQRHYATCPNFSFRTADIFNKFYNPHGRVRAEDFTFPYADASFDFAFATSVFTHMPQAAIAHYLRETARVLVPGGRALLTVFLWNAESQALVSQGKSRLRFREYGDLIVADPVVPEDAMATRQGDWDKALEDAGLRPARDVLWGSWCGRTRFTSFQDIVLVEKPK